MVFLLLILTLFGDFLSRYLRFTSSLHCKGNLGSNPIWKSLEKSLFLLWASSVSLSVHWGSCQQCSLVLWLIGASPMAQRLHRWEPYWMLVLAIPTEGEPRRREGLVLTCRLQLSLHHTKRVWRGNDLNIPRLPLPPWCVATSML